MIARARCVIRRGRHAYEILDGDEAGIVFYAYDGDGSRWPVGEIVTVRYTPADQFARRARAGEVAS